MRRLASIASIGCLVASLGHFAGCASSREGSFPEDFSISIMVPRPHDDPAMLSGWVVVDADGTLRVSAGDVDRRSRVPARAATLSRPELAELHARLEAAGLLAYGEAGAPVGEASTALQPPTTAAVSWSAGGRRRSLVLEATAPEDTAALAAIASIYAELRAQAWETASP